MSIDSPAPGSVAAYIEQTLAAAFPGATFSVRDTTGTDDHFEVEIEAAAFAGTTRIAQHRLVYAALGEPVGRQIHALALRTRAPQNA
ncbi:MAG: BolA family transcriptional regulator [Deltaproteobacteria bacterium]|nr:BolA family transcriptional regulator [Deltaproteobacteria bacterium]